MVFRVQLLSPVFRLGIRGLRFWVLGFKVGSRFGFYSCTNSQEYSQWRSSAFGWRVKIPESDVLKETELRL